MACYPWLAWPQISHLGRDRAMSWLMPSRTISWTASPQTSQIADKGYDADHLCERIAQTGGEVVIPPKCNRSFKRPYDAELYKERNIIERFFNKLKQFRRVATRYDKLLANFMGFVKLAAIAIWLK